MNKLHCLAIFTVLLFTSCKKEEPIITETGNPVVTSESCYSVLVDEDVTYAEGLIHNSTSASPFATPLKLDVYYPDNSSTNRPVYMFIHGGGFQGGTKTKPEIVDMANHFASRGWVFVSIDYRAAEDLGVITGMTPQSVSSYYSGIVPQEWLDYSLLNTTSPNDVKTSSAIYTAQRDAKAALRWIVANCSLYNIDTDFITVGGASAGAITTVALGISNQEDFRDEMSISEDPTLSTTNLNQTFNVQSLVYFWGSNLKLELFEAVYGLNQYDANDPELFMAHGTNDQNLSTPYSEAIELQGIYESLGIYNELMTLDGAGHGAWNATVNGKNLSQMSFDFLVERQNLSVQ